METDEHRRTIIHIDLDCFYAQVEMIKDPKLYHLPLGIQQKNIIVTSNYVARQRGVGKCVRLAEALKLCPDLVVVNGEDLHAYRKVSYDVTAYLKRYSDLVERLGLDENFVDVTGLVETRLGKTTATDTVGNVFHNDEPDLEADENCCQCGCDRRLRVGTQIASEIRDGLERNLKLTSCAGIAHNKLLAKLAGAVHKPNQQTVVFPRKTMELMLSLRTANKIPGIGTALTDSLEKVGVRTIGELQDCDFETLKLAVGEEKGRLLKGLSHGRDYSEVKASGRPSSIGIEDSCQSINAEVEIRKKFQGLLTRLLVLVREDGRLPRTLKITVRKLNNKISHRETRQCNVSPSAFAAKDPTPDAQAKLLSLVMLLFRKLVDGRKPYHITLLGLAFTKFQERANGKQSIAAYFAKDISVQSLTDIESATSPSERGPACSPQPPGESEGSESEVEPSPKKPRHLLPALRIYKHLSRKFDNCMSPSKLRVAELHLDVGEADLSGCSRSSASEGRVKYSGPEVRCPPDADAEVFRALPADMQRELWDDWRRRRSDDEPPGGDGGNPTKRTKTNTLHNYFVKN